MPSALPNTHYTSREVYEHISKETNDPIVQWKTCRISGQDFAIFQSDLDFYDKISPTFSGQKFHIPTPTLCPEERQRRRLSFRNERKLHKTKCHATQKEIISMQYRSSNTPIYDQSIRWSNKRSGQDYAKKYTGEQNIFSLLGELEEAIPKINLINDNISENSGYVNQTTHLSNCYLIFDADYCQNCFYSSTIKNSDRIIDSLNVYSSENTYECINCTNIYNCKHSIDCNQCSYVDYSINCTGCNHCFGCSNLINKEYHINNISYTKEEYKKEVSKRKKEQQHNISFQKAYYHIQSKNCTGNNIYQSKNTHFSYNIEDSSNIKYSSRLNTSNNCYDFDIWGDQCEWIYEGETIGENSSHVFFCRACWGSNSFLFYCINVMNSSHCFGCVGLRNAQYCIFNKQYTKETYEKTVAQIITQMQQENTRGEFFDPSLSPFAYNHTIAQDLFPLTEETATQLGLHRSNTPNTPIKTNKIIPGKKLPTNISQIPDDIVNYTISCNISQKPFRITKQELSFYRKHNISIPTTHPDIRHKNRLNKTQQNTLYIRKCNACKKNMLSIYPETYPQKVYCDSCYQKEVF